MENNYKEKVLQAMLCMTRQCWEQGIAGQCLLETGEDEKLNLLVYDMVLRQSADGRLCNVEDTPAVTDSAFCIPSVYIVGQLQKNNTYLEAAQRNVDFLLHKAERAEDGTLFHMRGTKEIWADSAAYLPYSLALTGHREEGFAQMKGILKRLYNKESGLYFHMWDEGTQSYLRPLPWGVGNGWILTGLYRLMQIFKEASPEREWLKDHYFSLLEKMLSHMTEKGRFHDILNDPDTFEESETAGMVAHMLYWSVYDKLLPTSCLTTADLIRTSLYEKVTPNGLVLDSASSPSFNRPGTSVECQAHFLFMEEAWRTTSHFLSQEKQTF